MVTLVIVNNKGGVAKTTTAANVGAYLAYKGKSVLLVDSDAQANLTQHFNFYDDIGKTIVDSFEDVKKLEPEIKPPLLQVNDNLFLIPSDPRLALVEESLSTYENPREALKFILEPVAEYFDYCLIDLPPSLGNLTKCAVFAADGVIIPIEAGQFSLNGVTNLVSYLNKLKTGGRLKFDIVGAFMAKYDERKAISQAVKEQVHEYFRDKMFNTDIRINTEVEKAQANGKDIFDYAKNSHSAEDYGNLSDEILNRLSKLTV